MSWFLLSAAQVSSERHPPAAAVSVVKPGDPIIVDAAAFGGNGGVIGLTVMNVLGITVSTQTPISPALASGTNWLREPVGVAVDAAGYILVAEKDGFSGNGGVVQVNPTTGVQTPLTSERAFINPSGIAVQPNGDLVDSDAYNGLGAVVRVNRERNEQTPVSVGGVFGNPSGIALEASGNILVVDPDLNNGAGGVVRIFPNGQQQTIASGGNFGNPSGIAVNAAGQIFVVDPDLSNGAGGVVQIDPVSNVRTTITSGGNFGNPSGIAVEASGNLLVADPDAAGGNGAVLRINPTTGTRTIIASGGNFRDPIGVAIARLIPLPPVAPLGQVTYTRSAGLVQCDGPTYTVPAGVQRLRFEVIGDHGYDGTDAPLGGGSGGSGGFGGFGGRAIGELRVRPGEVLYLNVANSRGGAQGRRRRERR